MTSLRRALLGLGIAAFGIGLGAILLAHDSDHSSPWGLYAAVYVMPAWAFVGTGLYAWDRRPGNSIGPLMTAVGFTWFLLALQASNDSVPFVIGATLGNLTFAVLIHLLLSFPGGRLETRLQRRLVAFAYFVCTFAQLIWGLFTDPEKDGCQGCPENPFLIEGHATLAGIVDATQVVAALGAIGLTVVLVYLRWRRSEPQERRALTPIVFTGGAGFLVLMAMLTVDQLELADDREDFVFFIVVTIFALMPFAFLVGLLRSRIGKAEELTTSLSVENRELNAELEATVAELRASRTRIVEAGYEERRRVERDLHDGAQQRLVALAMNLRLARGQIGSDPEGAGELLDEAMEELGEATRELRELARGIHPAVLSDRGLEAALCGLADRSPVPVEIAATPPERLPSAVESATYFVIAEALTNVARYADAEAASVSVTRESGAVRVEVRDDGVGGADPEAGSGLRGLEDRVAALEGRLEVRSPAGEGTVVLARIPCAS